jgi:hypothetical protein
MKAYSTRTHSCSRAIKLDERETGLGIPPGSMSGQQRLLGAFDVCLSKSDPSELGEGPSQLASQVKDALRRFPADEILLVGGGATDSSLQTSLRGLGLPITWVGQSPPARGNRSRLRDAVRGLASGRSSATPFVAFAGANLALLLIGLLITLVVALIVWLTGLT